MRLLLTAHRMWPHVGGTETAVDQLATHFARRGHEVAVATSLEPGTPEREERHGYRIRRFKLHQLGKFRVPPREYHSFVLGGPWDLVQLHGQRVWSSDHLFPFLGRTRNPLVLTAHGFAQWHRDRIPGVDWAYYKVALPRALRAVGTITVLTDQEREDLLSWGVPADKLALIGDGYDPSEFASLPTGFRAKHGLASGERVLMYAGGFYANKRVDRLVEACAGLDATLVAFGTDADGSRAKLEALAKARGVRFRALGRAPREEVLSAYRESDLLLLGSDFEGYGLVLLEAMAAGLPFVSTPCGAAPRLAATGAGVLARDADAMREAVRALLADDARRAEMGRVGREAAKTFTWASIADEYLQLFEGVARR